MPHIFPRGMCSVCLYVCMTCLQIDVKLRLTDGEVISKPWGYTTHFTSPVRKVAFSGEVGMLKAWLNRQQLLSYLCTQCQLDDTDICPDQRLLIVVAVLILLWRSGVLI